MTKKVKKIIEPDITNTHSNLIKSSNLSHYYSEELKAIQRSIALLRQDLRKIINEELIKFLNQKRQQQQ